MKAWKQVIADMEKSPLARTDTTFTERLLNYQYGYVAWHLGNHNEEEAERVLIQADKNLIWLESKKFNPVLTHAYKASISGFWIGVSYWNIPSYAFKTSSSAEKAIELDSTNAFANIQMANIRFYQPVVLGGSKKEAIQYYLKAETIYEKLDLTAIKTDWVYLNLLATLAQSYDKFGELKKAKKYYQKLLTIQPSYKWVSDTMLPDLERRIEVMESNR